MKTFCLLVTVWMLGGCATSQSQPVPSDAQPLAEPGELPASVHWMRNSAEYQAVVRQTYALAAERLRRLVGEKETGSWAVALDADETVIVNSIYAKELALNRQESTDELWDGWVVRRAAPPLPGALEFLELVQGLGGRIAIVTNRQAEHCADTRANFLAFDIPFDVILCREGDRRKESRWQRVEAGTASADLPPLEIVLWLGDKIEDFPDLYQDIRFAEGAAFADFGDRFFVLPNPVYGYWMENPRD